MPEHSFFKTILLTALLTTGTALAAAPVPPDTTPSTQCSGNSFLEADGSCISESNAGTDNQGLPSVLNNDNSANQQIDMNGNSLRSTSVVEGSSDVTLRLDQNSGWVEVEDKGSNTREDIVVGRIYLNDNIGWFDGSHDQLSGVSYNDHHGVGSGIRWDGSNNIALNADDLDASGNLGHVDVDQASTRFAIDGTDVIMRLNDNSGQFRFVPYNTSSNTWFWGQRLHYDVFQRHWKIRTNLNMNGNKVANAAQYETDGGLTLGSCGGDNCIDAAGNDLHLNHNNGNGVQIGNNGGSLNMNGQDVDNIDDITGSTSTTDIYSSGGGRVLLRSKGSGGTLGWYDDNNNRVVQEYNNGGDLLLDPAGNVKLKNANLGVGTSPSQNEIHVDGGGSYNGMFIQDPTTNTNYGGKVVYNDNQNELALMVRDSGSDTVGLGIDRGNANVRIPNGNLDMNGNDIYMDGSSDPLTESGSLSPQVNPIQGYRFEGNPGTGNVPEGWTANSGDPHIDDTRGYDSSQSMRLGSGGNTAVASIYPEMDGQVITSWNYWETSSMCRVQMDWVNENGNRILRVGSENPQWEVVDAGGTTNIYGSSGYQDWHYVETEIDTQKDNYTLYWTNLETGHKETYSGNLETSADRISKIRAFDSCNDDAWVDNVNVMQSGSSTNQFLSVSGSDGVSHQTMTGNLDMNGNDVFSVGRLGAGTSSPSSMFHVKKTGNAGTHPISILEGEMPAKSTSTEEVIGSYEFWMDHNSLAPYARIQALNTASDRDKIGLSFQTQASRFAETDPTEKMRLTHDGNLDMNNNDINNVGTLNAETKNFIQSINTTHEVVYTSQESPDVRAVVEDTAEVVNGTAVVELPDHFSKTVSDKKSELKVQVTPNSVNTYGLAVTNRSNDQIAVKELMGGSHSFEFDYRVTGIREGYENKTVVREIEKPENTTAAPAT